MVYLDRHLVSSLDLDDFVYNQSPSQYLNNIHEYKKKLRHSVNYGRIKELHKISPKKEIISLKPNQENIEVLIDPKSLDITKLGLPPSRVDAAQLLEWMNENVKVSFIFNPK